MNSDSITVVTGHKDESSLFGSLVEQSQYEILILLGSPHDIVRYMKSFSATIDDAVARGVKVKILTSASDVVARHVFDRLQWRRTERINLGVQIFDRSSAILVEFAQESPDMNDAVLSRIYMSNSRTVKGMATIFDALWRESESHREERRSRRGFELLKDSIATDLDQSIRISGSILDLMKYKLRGDKELTELAFALEISLNCSVALVRRSRRLGRILSSCGENLCSMDLKSLLEESASQVNHAFGDKKLELLFTFVTEEGMEVAVPTFPYLVRGDALLVDVFTNLIFAVARCNYDGSFVPVKVTLANSELSSPPKTICRCWKVEISSARGYGKNFGGLFEEPPSAEYQTLDTELARELIVSRYGGHMEMKERQKFDGETREVTVEVVLPAEL